MADTVIFQGIPIVHEPGLDKGPRKDRVYIVSRKAVERLRQDGVSPEGFTLADLVRTLHAGPPTVQ